MTTQNDPTSNDLLPKSFEPQDIEARWYARWEQGGYFKAGQHVTPPEGAESRPFVIQFPPPNVTGTLHMGRSEERRVGKECRSRWSAYHEKKDGHHDQEGMCKFGPSLLSVACAVTGITAELQFTANLAP